MDAATSSLSTVANKPGRVRLTPMTAIVLAVLLGLCAGYVDLGVLVFKKYAVNPEGSYRSARDFPWTVPVGHVVLSVGVGAVLAVASRRWPDQVTLNAGAMVLMTLALWGALLRFPIPGVSSLVLSFGIGWVFSDVLASVGFAPRQRWVRVGLIVLIAPIVPLFGLSTGRQILREAQEVAALPTPAANAPNVLFIVIDTVRASNLSLYGYERETTPNLSRWAKKGVVYERALAPAPWTFPSHSSFFTGHWPLEIDSQWKYELNPTVPTLAEFLTSRGYQSTGFAANTNCCNYETGLGRGFLHFEDYSLIPRSLLSRTVPGKWLLEQFFSVVEPYQQKWTSLQSRGARDVNDAFLGWESRRRRDRPFFAFLNYFDAHEPFIPPAETAGRFGVRPQGMRDHQFLVDYVGADKSKIRPRDFIMARDCYDDCIAHLDDQIGRLLDELERRGALKNTVVVITSDHGEAFAEHGTVGHSYSVNLEEVRVPLLILAPEAPAGRRIYRAISLRDIASTVTDLSGLSDTSPFPGRSLTAYWKLPPGPEPAGLSSPAFSEQASEAAFSSSSAEERAEHYQMSTVAFNGYQYIRNGTGQEQLYYLWEDPLTQRNIIIDPGAAGLANEFRRMLLQFLNETPGTPEAEKAYLKTFREGLADAIHQPREQHLTSLKRPPD